MQGFLPPPGAIRAQGAIDIDARPEYVAALYRNVARWGQTFPATIEAAQVIESGDNWQKVEVTHKMEGRVPNLLGFLSDTEIRLEEKKGRFDAWFLNHFQLKAAAEKPGS